MSQSFIGSADNEASTCEVIGCFADATTRVALKVGKKITVSVNVCMVCAESKFAGIKEKESIF